MFFMHQKDSHSSNSADEDSFSELPAGSSAGSVRKPKFTKEERQEINRCVIFRMSLLSMDIHKLSMQLVATSFLRRHVRLIVCVLRDVHFVVKVMIVFMRVRIRADLILC